MRITSKNLNSFKTKGTKTYTINNRRYEVFQCEDLPWGVNFYEGGQLTDVSRGEMLLREVKEEIIIVANYYNK